MGVSHRIAPGAVVNPADDKRHRSQGGAVSIFEETEEGVLNSMTKLESLKALWVRTFSPLVSDDGRLGVWLDNCSTPEIIFSMKAAAKRVKKKGVFESPAHAIR